MGNCSTGSCNGSVGSSGFINPAQLSQRGGPEVQTTGCEDGSCGSSSTGSANGSCSGGSCGGGKAAYTSPGCSGGSCGGSKASKTGGGKAAGGSCGPGGCGGGEEGGGKKAQKAGCENGQCDGKKGLLKATIMTVAASELSQLTIDYSQYLS